MSLNDLRLPNFIIAELYKDSLLVSPGPSQTLPPTTSIPPPSAPPASSAKTPDASTPPASAPPTSDQSAKSPAASTPPADPATLKFLGNHRRKTTILVDSPGFAFLPDDQLSFLTKMLEACRMNIGDVAIINTAAAPVTIAALRQQLQPEKILLFGLEPTSIRLPINFPAFRLQPYDDCTYLSAPAFDLLTQPTEESRLLKSKLWVSLKSLFNV